MECQVFDADAVTKENVEQVELLIALNKTLASIILAMVKTAQRIMHLSEEDAVYFESSQEVDDYYLMLEGVINEKTKAPGVKVKIVPTNKMQH